MILSPLIEMAHALDVLGPRRRPNGQIPGAEPLNSLFSVAEWMMVGCASGTVASGAKIVDADGWSDVASSVRWRFAAWEAAYFALTSSIDLF